MKAIIPAVLLFAAACTATTGATGDTAPGVPSSPAAVQAVLNDIVVAWNRDDLAGHVAPYSETATYTQPDGLMVGRAAIQEMLRSAFARPDGLAGRLEFQDVKVTMMGADHAMATGAFLVEKVQNDRDIRGRFTLILQRTAAGWQIIHDHSS